MSMQRQTVSTKATSSSKWTPTWIGPEIPYYLNFHMPNVMTKFQYRVRNMAIVYGIRCKVTGKTYIGSSFTPGRRMYMHLIMGEQSNAKLQADIANHGLKSITVYILEVVHIPSDIDYTGRKAYLLEREQAVMDHFIEEELYNFNRAKK